MLFVYLSGVYTEQSSSSFSNLFYAFFFLLKPYRMGVSSFFRWWVEQCFSYIFLVYIQSSPPLLFLIIFFIFSFKVLQNGAFRYFWRMKEEEDGSFILRQAAVLIKSSVYAGFKMSWSMVYSHNYRFFNNFSYCMKRQSSSFLIRF